MLNIALAMLRLSIERKSKSNDMSLNMTESTVVHVIFNKQQLIDHVLHNVPPVRSMTTGQMLEAACEPTKTVWSISKILTWLRSIRRGT